MSRKNAGEIIPVQQLEAVDGRSCALPHPSMLTHLQFRRFAGCPVCNLHLRGFAARHRQLQEQGIREIAVFHSGPQALLAHAPELPFALVADPHRKLYRAFGLETSPLALLHPQAWWAGLRGVLRHGLALPAAGESVLGLPADFLIDPQGRILALKYGRHADDQWSVDELLALARRFTVSGSSS